MAYLNSRPRTPEVCPVCGENVPARALACPECGADHHSGWREDYLDGVDVPEEEFNYEEFVAEEFGGGRKGLHPVWWITGIVLLVVLALGWLIFGQ